MLLFILMDDGNKYTPAQLNTPRPSELNSTDKDRTVRQLREENLQLKKLVEELRRDIITDSLTGIYNRGGLEILMSEKINELNRLDYREKPHFSLLCIDMDNFRYINNQYGHLAGDQALQNIAGIFSMRLREADIIGRYGGDEFIVGLIDTDERASRQVAEDLIKLVASKPISIDTGEEIPLSISIGISPYRHHTDWRELFNEADQAMNSAKRNYKGSTRSFNELND